jgi:Rrf2 family iron-sulfur cluster assembly transcriptional regulator
MRLTTKGRFAVTAMVDLALREGQGPVTLAQISERHHISLSYLEQLFGKLRKQALVRSTRGPGGGYTLARKPEATSVADIILAVDEPLDATQCGGRENCNGESKKCITHDLWTSLNTHIFEYLGGVKLSTLVAEQRAREAQARRQAQVVEMPASRRGSRHATAPVTA